MADVLFANDANSILSAPVAPSDVSLTVADGSTFNSPGANQYFIATIADAATQLIKEIVHVTARASGVMTIVRAQEGTTAKSWNVGDIVAELWTAGAGQAMLQQGQQQAQASNYAVDTGTVNAIVAALSPVPTALSAIVGTPIRIKMNFKTTSSTVSLNLNGLGAQQVLLPDGTPPFIGMFVNGATYEFMWNGAFFQPTNILAFPASLPFAGGLNTANYQKFPTGLIMQFGNFTCTSVNAVLTLPVAFPTRQFCSVGTVLNTGSASIAAVMSMGPASSPPVSQNLVTTYSIINSAPTVGQSNYNFSWIAFGN